MARSQYVYQVIDPGKLPQPFTVRHEMLTWAGTHPDPGGRQVWRMDDGPRKRQPSLINPELLMLWSGQEGGQHGTG